jgi:hypothetical protein
MYRLIREISQQRVKIIGIRDHTVIGSFCNQTERRV